MRGFDPSEVARSFRYREDQSPTLLAGFHHQWAPESHTLFLFGRFADDLTWQNPEAQVLGADYSGGTVNGFAPVGVGIDYRSQVTLYAAELQQAGAQQSLGFEARREARWEPLAQPL